jgi:hypothetical protein
MPVYSAKASGLVLNGPILEVQLLPGVHAAAAMQRAGLPIPPPITVAALIDTGASCTVVTSGIPAQLGLQPMGSRLVNTPTSQKVPCPTYAIRIIFPSTGGIKSSVGFDAVVMEAPLQGQNIQCLIGRDFLQHAILIYSGPDEMFTLSL